MARICANLKVLSLLSLLLGFAWGTGPVHAQSPPGPERIFLKNGDIISGKIVEIKGDVVIIETKYAGKIQLSRKEIAKMEPPIPSRFTLKTGEVKEGRVTGISEKEVTLTTSESTSHLPKKDIWGMEVIGRERSAWSGGIGAGLSFTDGNSDTLGYNLHGSLLRESYWNEFRLKGDYFFGESEGTTDTNRASGDMRIVQYIRRPWFIYFIQRLETDRIADVNITSDTGAGLGLLWLDREDIRFGSEVGPGYQFTRFKDGNTEESTTGRIGSFLRIIFPKNIRLTLEGEYIQALKDHEDFLIRSEATLSIPIGYQLNFNVKVQDRYDNTPAEGSERNDVTLFSGMDYSF